MKLARFRHHNAERIGLVVSEGVIDASAHLSAAPSSMAELMNRWDEFRPKLQALENEREPDYPLASVTLLSPVARPGKIMAMGLNYADHAKESGMELPKFQLWFTKAVTTISDPYGTIQLPRVSTQMDYEAELVVVIGRRCRHVSSADAASVILGYCVGDDVSVRDWQLQTSQWSLGKSFDTHGPIGPWIVTADSLDPHHLAIRSLVNGEVRQNSNTDQFVFNCFQMIEHLSKAMTLEPGDLIFTGTPPGVGMAMKPPSYLRDGDLVRIEIEGIGAIENRVVKE